jgi:hypothetical protein
MMIATVFLFYTNEVYVSIGLLVYAEDNVKKHDKQKSVISLIITRNLLVRYVVSI